MTKDQKKARKMLEDAVWNRTHRDFRGGRGSNRSILVMGRSGGSTLAYLSSMSDAKLRELLGVGGFEQRLHERRFVNENGEVEVKRTVRRMAKIRR